MVDDWAVFYVTNRTEDAQRAVISARSLKAHNPEIYTFLYTEGSPDYDKSAFDHVTQYRKLDHPEWYLRQTGYIGDIIRDLHNRWIKSAVFLDCDTYICSDISDLFRILGAVDFACTIAPRRYMTSNDTHIPSSFPEWNTGVMPISINGRTIDFWDDFYTFYKNKREYYGDDDQIPLRAMIYNTMASNRDIHFFCLAPEWNFRFNFACQASREVKILHGKSDNLAEIAAKANAETGIRAWENGIKL